MCLSVSLLVFSNVNAGAEWISVFNQIMGTICMARSPATAIAIIKELRSKGKMTTTFLSITVLSDVYVLVAVSITVSIAQSGMIQVKVLLLIVTGLWTFANLSFSDMPVLKHIHIFSYSMQWHGVQGSEYWCRSRDDCGLNSAWNSYWFILHCSDEKYSLLCQGMHAWNMYSWRRVSIHTRTHTHTHTHTLTHSHTHTNLYV